MSKIVIKIISVLFVICISTVTLSSAQNSVRKLGLQDVISLARSQSPDYSLAKHRFKSSYWEYRTYKAQTLPSLSTDILIPDFQKSINKVTQPDGEVKFINQSYSNSSINLALAQNVGFTGGKVFLSSNLQALNTIYDSSNTYSYLTSPLSIGYSQPLFAYNPFKWDKKIEPLRYTEAKNQYIESLERISLDAVNYFFDLALAQLNLQIAEMNYKNNDTLYKIAQGRYNLGKIAQNELLQMELAWLNSDVELNNAKLDLEMNKIKLRSFLGFNESTDFELILPQGVPELKIDADQATAYAKQNSAELLSLQRMLIEAQRDVNKARVENRYNANLFVSYGLTQSAADLSGAYQDPQNQQRLTVGLQVPIVDWGLAKGKYKMAKSNQDMVKINVSQSEIDFLQNLYLKVKQFNIQQKQLIIAAKADTVAQLRFDVAKQRFYIGKIFITDLNIALSEKDLAKRAYLSQLKYYWQYYYDIRRLTLYDFERNAPLSVNYDELIK
jgi:outer membrane protein TolC